MVQKPLIYGHSYVPLSGNPPPIFFAVSVSVKFSDEDEMLWNYTFTQLRGEPRIQGDQLNMTVVFWYLGKSAFSSVHVYSGVHWTNHIIQGTRNTRPCITGHPVPNSYCTQVPDIQALMCRTTQRRGQACPALHPSLYPRSYQNPEKLLVNIKVIINVKVKVMIIKIKMSKLYGTRNVHRAHFHRRSRTRSCIVYTNLLFEYKMAGRAG